MGIYAVWRASLPNPPTIDGEAQPPGGGYEIGGGQGEALRGVFEPIPIELCDIISAEAKNGKKGADKRDYRECGEPHR